MRKRLCREWGTENSQLGIRNEGTLDLTDLPI